MRHIKKKDDGTKDPVSAEFKEESPMPATPVGPPQPDFTPVRRRSPPTAPPPSVSPEVLQAREEQLKHFDEKYGPIYKLFHCVDHKSQKIWYAQRVRGDPGWVHECDVPPDLVEDFWERHETSD